MDELARARAQAEEDREEALAEAQGLVTERKMRELAAVEAARAVAAFEEEERRKNRLAYLTVPARGGGGVLVIGT